MLHVLSVIMSVVVCMCVCMCVSVLCDYRFRIKEIGNGICNDTCMTSCCVCMTMLQMEFS